MSTETLTRLQLLKLSKKELIKRCRAFDISIDLNGTKNDMVDCMLIGQEKQKKIQAQLARFNICFYKFEANKMKRVKNKLFNDMFKKNDIFNTLVHYLPIYTLSNIMCAFPKYDYYSSLRNDIEEISKISVDIDAQKRKKTSQNNKQTVAEYMRKTSKISCDKLAFKYEKVICRETSGRGWSNTKSIIFNKTDIYNIDQFLKLYAGIKYGNDEPVDTLIETLDDIGLNDIYNMDKEDECLFAYLFLELILSMDGTKYTIYSSKYHMNSWSYHERTLSDDSDDCNPYNESYEITFLFKDKRSKTIYKIKNV